MDVLVRDDNGNTLFRSNGADVPALVSHRWDELTGLDVMDVSVDWTPAMLTISVSTWPDVEDEDEDEDDGDVCLAHGKSPLFDINTVPRRCEFAEAHEIHGQCIIVPETDAFDYVNEVEWPGTETKILMT